jgi:hypothetical protein
MLVSVSLLLMIASLVTLHTGRVKSLEHKILLNTQNQAQSAATALGGLAHGMSRIQVDSGWLGQEHTIMLDNNLRAKVWADFHQVPRNNMNLHWATVYASGESADEQSHHYVSEQVLRYPFLNTVPPAPLISAIELPSNLPFILGANPNGGGQGVPVSVWSDKPIPNINVDSRTCSLQLFDESRCAFDMYSTHSQLGSDLLKEHSAFPGDVLSYLFNISMNDWRILKSEVSLIASDCDEATVTGQRVIWVQGECALNVGQHIGSDSAPVILVLANSALLMPADSRIFGLVVFLSTLNPAPEKRIAMATSAQLNGALVLLSPIEVAMSQLSVRYHASVLERLHLDADMQRLGKVSGSWRDF